MLERVPQNARAWLIAVLLVGTTFFAGCGSGGAEPMMFFVSGPGALSAGDYGFRNLFDGDTAKAWCTKNLRHADGRKLVIEFEEPIEWQSLELQGGYFKSEKIFRANGRLKQAAIQVNDSEWPLKFPDARQRVSFDFPKGTRSSELVIALDQVYEPDSSCDFCISELQIKTSIGSSRQLMNPGRESASDDGVYARWTEFPDESRCDFRIDPSGQLVGTLGDCPWFPDESLVGFGDKGLIFFNWRDRYEAARFSRDCSPPEGEQAVPCIQSLVTEWYLLEE